MVSIVDELTDGLSSVYTFFDPSSHARATAPTTSCGRSSRRALLKLPYVYLGYWIAQSRKMGYKTQFRPHEGLVDGTSGGGSRLPRAKAERGVTDSRTRRAPQDLCLRILSSRRNSFSPGETRWGSSPRAGIPFAGRCGQLSKSTAAHLLSRGEAT